MKFVAVGSMGDPAYVNLADVSMIEPVGRFARLVMRNGKRLETDWNWADVPDILAKAGMFDGPPPLSAAEKKLAAAHPPPPYRPPPSNVRISESLLLRTMPKT